jgi:hypothetical protein
MRALLFALAAGALLSAPAAAGDGPLAQLNFLQGCWHGEFQTEAGVTDTRCFEPMLGGQFVRDTHVVHGGREAYRGESVYYLDAQTQQLSFTYYASDGGVMHGTGVVNDQGMTFPPAQFITTDGGAMTVRARWRREGADRYVATTEIQDHGQWRTLHTIVYVRTSSVSPPAQ